MTSLLCLRAPGFAFRVTKTIFRGVTREGQEHLIECRSSQTDVIDFDVRLVEITHNLDESLSTAMRRNHDLPGVLVHRAVTFAITRQDLDGARQIRADAHDHFDALATDGRLQLIRR